MTKRQIQIQKKLKTAYYIVDDLLQEEFLDNPDLEVVKDILLEINKEIQEDYQMQIAQLLTKPMFEESADGKTITTIPAGSN